MVDNIFRRDGCLWKRQVLSENLIEVGPLQCYNISGAPKRKALEASLFDDIKHTDA